MAFLRSSSGRYFRVLDLCLAVMCSALVNHSSNSHRQKPWICAKAVHCNNWDLQFVRNKAQKKKSPSYVLQMVPFPTCKKLTYESFLLSRLLRNSSITITQRHLKYSYSKHNNFLTFWNNSSKIMLLSNHNDKCSSSSFLFSFILVLGGILPQSSAKSFASFPLLWRAQQQCSVHRKTTVLLLYLTNCIFTPS